MLAACVSAHAGQDSEFQAAKGYYTLGEYKDAVTKLEKFIADYPKSERLEGCAAAARREPVSIEGLSEGGAGVWRICG